MEDPTRWTGRIFAERFRVEAEVGRGSMAVVFRATHLVTEQAVALKVMKEPVDADEPRTRRFLQEIRATARLNHPNTVRVLDAGRSPDGLLWLAMEYLEGESLRQALDREGRFSPARAMHVARQIAGALAEAHSKLLVHRDLKPENILLTSLNGESDFVKVLDFGVAKFLSDQPGEEPLTRTGDLLGTPLYLAPEQALERAVDGRSDLYSLGCILVEMLTGAPPFRASTPVAIVMRHIHDPAPRLSERLADVPPELDALVAGMLAKEPSGRPETMQKWLEAARHLPRLPTQVLPARVAEESEGPAPEEATILLEVRREAATPGLATAPAAPRPSASAPPTPVARTPAGQSPPPPPPQPVPRPLPTPPQESEEDVVFLEANSSETLLIPREEMASAPPPRPAVPAAPGADIPAAKGASAGTKGPSRIWPVAIGLVLMAGAAGAWWRLAGPGSPSLETSASVAATTPVEARDNPPPGSGAAPRNPEAPVPTEPESHAAPAAHGTATAEPSSGATPGSGAAPEASASSLEVSLLTDPPGAEVVLDGNTRGKTPYRLVLRATDPLLRLTLKAPGYRDLSLTLLPRDLVSSGRRDLTWQLQKESGASRPAARPPAERPQEAGPAAPARPAKKPAINWDE